MSNETPPGEDKTRLVLLLAAIMWVSAMAAFVIGVRLHVKPIMLVGGLDALLAMLVTMIALAGWGRKRG